MATVEKLCSLPLTDMDFGIMESQENKLRLEILGDAQKKGDAIRARAEQENGQRLTETRAELRRKRAESLHELEAELALAQRQADNHLALAVRRRWLQEREKAINGILQEVCAEAEASHGSERTAILAHLATEALTALGPGSYRVTCAPSDCELVTPAWLQQQIAAEITLEVCPDAAIRGGLRFTATDGRVCFDNTFATRLTLLRGELRRILASAPDLEPASEQGAGSDE